MTHPLRPRRPRFLPFFRPLLGLLPGLLLAGGGGLLGGCVAQRQLPYLQDRDYSTTQSVASPNVRPVYHLQPNDVLSVRVQGAQPELTEIFNLNDNRLLPGNDPGITALTGYYINPAGDITLPTVGKVHVAGLTLDEVQALVQQRVSGYVRVANVLVKLLSFRFTVLGEVRAPGRFFIYNGQATLFEGLGMAGDLTEFGNRTNVKLVRQTKVGSEVVLLDLTDPHVLSSPYFYLQPNDALYIEPLPARASRGNINNLGVVFGGVSALVLLLSLLIK